MKIKRFTPLAFLALMLFVVACQPETAEVIREDTGNSAADTAAAQSTAPARAVTEDYEESYDEEMEEEAYDADADDSYVEVEVVREVEVVTEIVTSVEQPEVPETANAPEEFFADNGVNPFVMASVDNLSTFALDVDTGSYTVARNYLTDGVLPPPEAIRVEEFVNYFEQGYASPPDSAFAVYADGAPSPFPFHWNRQLLMLLFPTLHLLLVLPISR